jgi:outer membrane protein assembly factor BamB
MFLGTKQIWVIAKDIKGSLSIPSDTIEFEAIDEGYVKGVFQATTDPDQGEVDTVGMQSSPVIAAIGGAQKIFIGSEFWYAYIINAADMQKELSIDPTDIRCFCASGWGNSPAVDIQNLRWYIANDVWGFFGLGTNGSRLWYYPPFPGGHFGLSFTDAAFNGNYVYVATRDTLYALNGTNGSKFWGYSIPGIAIKTAPIIDVEGNVYIGDDSGYVRKINGTTGELIWQHDLGSLVPTSGAIDNITGTIYFGVNDISNSYLCALEPDSDALQWSYPIANTITNSPVIGTDCYIYIGDDNGRLYVVKDGSLKSGFPISLSASFSTPAFAADGYFYLNTDDQRVFCISINGKVRWETQLPIIATKKYRKLREDFVPSPVIGSDGDIYVAAGEDENGLYRLKGRSTGTSANTPWPMFRHDRNHSGKAGFVPSR